MGRCRPNTSRPMVSGNLPECLQGGRTFHHLHGHRVNCPRIHGSGQNQGTESGERRLPDVFVSYSREDQLVARRFAEGFEREGLSVWWDQSLNPGEAFDQVTERALDDAKAVVVLWSKASVNSRWVRAEATQANANNRLLPVMIEACRRPIMFELTHTSDLSRWEGSTDDPAWQSFVASVHRFVQRAAPDDSASSTSPALQVHTAPPNSGSSPPNCSEAARGSRPSRESPAAHDRTSSQGTALWRLRTRADCRRICGWCAAGRGTQGRRVAGRCIVIPAADLPAGTHPFGALRAGWPDDLLRRALGR